MNNNSKIWIARLISLAISSAILTVLFFFITASQHAKSKVTITTDMEQTVVMQKIKDSGVESKSIKIENMIESSPVHMFAMIFLAYGIFFAPYLGIYYFVKAIILKKSSNQSMEPS